MKSDGSGARQITEGIPVLSYPAWHPDGKEIVFVTKGNDGHEIWTYNIHDSRLTTHNLQLTIHDSRFTTHDSLNYPFTKFLYRIGYNPTGDKITFESNRSGNIEIWTMKSDGTNLARITNGDGPHWNPVWSPDGKRIAYTTDKLGEEAGLHNWRNYNIWVANPETQKEMLITGEEQIDWNPVWSPDGKKIVYVTNRSGDLKHFSLWVLYLK
jgi:TolB protein